MRILYLCADLGVPVLGHKGASIHVRELASALRRAGHDVVVAAASLTTDRSDEPVRFGGVEHLPPSPRTLEAAAAVESVRERVGATSPLSRDLRRILYDSELRRAL